MWIQRGKKGGFCSVIFILLLFLASTSRSSDLVPAASVLDTAFVEAVKRFGRQSSSGLIASFYDVQGAPAIHVFLVTKHPGFLFENIERSIAEAKALRTKGESLIRMGQIEEGRRVITSSRDLLLREDEYGTLLVSAEEKNPSLVAFHHGLPTYLLTRPEAEERAEAFSGGDPVTPLGVLYLSPLEYFFEFDSGGRRLLVSPFHSGVIRRVGSAEVSKITSVEVSGDKPENHGESPAASDQVAQSSDSVLIIDVPDYQQRPSLPNSCGPTAGACLLGYWDGQGYDDLLPGSGNYEDVTHLIEELCDAMDWEAARGVYYADIPTGLNRLSDDRGYSFNISNRYRVVSIDTAKQEVDHGRPFIYGSQENPWDISHYVVVVGYQENFLIVHDNWSSTPVDYYVHWDALGHDDDTMAVLVPEGEEITSSDSLPSDLGGGGGGCFIATVTQASKSEDSRAVQRKRD